MPVVHKRRPSRDARRKFQSTALLLNLVNDFAAYLPLSLDFHNVHKSLRLQQKVDLTAFALAPDLAIRRSRRDERT